MSNPYTSPSAAGYPQEHPNGTAVLILGIVGIFVPVCAPIAWFLGNKAVADVTSGGQFSNESQIRTGRMLGKVFTIIYIISIVRSFVIGIVFLVVVASQQ